MDLNRRQIIKGIGAALCAGVVPKFVPELVGGESSGLWGLDVATYKSWLPTDEHTHIVLHEEMLKKMFAADIEYQALIRSSFWTHIKAHSVSYVG